MANISLIFGIFLLLIGLISITGKIFNIKKMFWKLESYENNYGKKWGKILHTIIYIIIPIIVGIILIWFNI